MSIRAVSWEISPARDPKNFDTSDSISAKLDYMLWCLQYTFLDKEQETLVKPKFVSQGADSVQGYVARFEDWKSVVWAGEVDVSESYFVSVFANGLREEIGGVVQVLEPHTLSEAKSIAKMQEGCLESMRRKHENGFESSSNEKNSSSNSLQRYDQLGRQLMEERAPKNEVPVKVNFSEKIGDNKVVPEGKVSMETFCSINRIDGEEKWGNQILKAPSIINDEIKLGNELDCSTPISPTIEDPINAEPFYEINGLLVDVGKIEGNKGYSIHRNCLEVMKISKLNPMESIVMKYKQPYQQPKISYEGRSTCHNFTQEKDKVEEQKTKFLHLQNSEFKIKAKRLLFVGVIRPKNCLFGSPVSWFISLVEGGLDMKMIDRKQTRMIFSFLFIVLFEFLSM